MKRILLSCLILVVSISSFGQDYIVTWNNDTLFCTFPGKPRKEGIKLARKYNNGHIRLFAFFPNDSVRAIEAGEIKGYYREKHGKSLLCNGFFEAKKIVFVNNKTLNTDQRQADRPWYFMQRLVAGRFASLYIIYLYSGYNTPSAYYYITRKDSDSLKATSLSSKKTMLRLLMDDDIAGEMEKVKYRNSQKGYTDIINEYNRLKEATIQAR